MPERIVSALALEYRDEPDGPQRRASQGQVVDLSADELARIEDLEENSSGKGSILVPEGFESFDEFAAYKLDVYRGRRGDTEAVGRAVALAEARGGGIVNLSEQAGAGSSYASQIEGGLNGDDTIALAQNSPQKAAEVLAAEHEATGGKPRKTVVKALTKLIGGEE